MKYYEKFDVFSNPEIIPSLKMQIAEAECYHCGRVTRFPVQTEHVDWERIAEKYRTLLEDYIRETNRMISDIDVMHDNNPAADYLVNKWKFLLSDLESKF